MRGSKMVVASVALLSCVGLVASANVAVAAEPAPGEPVQLTARQAAEYKDARDAAGLGPGLVGPRSSSEMAEEARLDRAKFDSLTPKGGVGVLATSKVITVTHSSQSYKWWCGPSAVAMGIRAHGGTSPTQTTLASQLKTTRDGTAWSGVYVSTSPSTGRPVKDVLNNRLGTSWYIAVDLPTSPTTTQKTDYKNRLVRGIDYNYGLVGGAWEIPGYAHLNGHPLSVELYHYVTMTGYSSSGATTRYGDPASGSDVSWAGSVAPFSSINSDKLVTIVGGRGYVW